MAAATAEEMRSHGGICVTEDWRTAQIALLLADLRVQVTGVQRACVPIYVTSRCHSHVFHDVIETPWRLSGGGHFCPRQLRELRQRRAAFVATTTAHAFIQVNS